VKALSDTLHPGRVAVVGDLFADLLFADLDHDPAPGTEVYARRFAIEPGGHGITAVTLARLGRPVSLAAVVGTDPLADLIVDRLASEGVDVGCLVRAPGATPVTAAIAYAGDRSFVTRPGGGDDDAKRRAAECALGSGATHLHLSAGHPLADRLLERAATAGLSTSLAVGWHPDLLSSARLRERMARATIVALNEREALTAAGASDLDGAVARLAGGCRWLLVTLGAAGSLLACGERRWRAAAAPARAIDTTGAGDVFLATLLDAAMAGLDEDAALRRASLVAARATEHLGGATGVPRGGALALDK
jgi:ribokinase